VEEVEKVQDFHVKIQAILQEESKDELVSTNEEIGRINDQIGALGKRNVDLEKPVGVSESYVDQISDIKAEITRLESLNKNYTAREDIRINEANAKKELRDAEKDYLVLMDEKINSTLSGFIAEMFPNESHSKPALEITDNGKYFYNSFNDGGSGTAYRDLLLFDLAIMKLSSLPVLIHDNHLTKTIEDKTIERLFPIYQEVGKDKQIFISFDGLPHFEDTAMRQEVNDSTVLSLSQTGDNYLYGRHFEMDKDKAEKKGQKYEQLSLL
jgi:hypothetical protein